MTIVFGKTPPLPTSCPTCKRPKWHWSGTEWQCLTCANPNPCITLFGKGPEGRKCKDCVHLQGFRQSATWYKCSQRSWKAKASGTTYPGKDHRVHWQACARFEEDKKP